LRIAVLVALAALPMAGVPSKAETPKKKTRHTAATTARRRAAGSKITAHRGKSSKKKAAAWRSRQLAPTPERYKEIQGALVSRGYLKQSPTGVWDAESGEALRRFQKDQNLEPTGKLSSLSLIALGLGAKHGGPVAPVKAPAATPQAAPPTAPPSPPPA